MPSKTRTKNAAIAATTAALPTITKELIEQFVKGFDDCRGCQRGVDGAVGHHLGQAAVRGDGLRNHRNGGSAKTVVTDEGPLRIDVPRTAKAASNRC